MSTAKPGEAGEAVRVAVLARRAQGAPSTVNRLSKRAVWACQHCGWSSAVAGWLHGDSWRSYLKTTRQCRPTSVWLEDARVCTWCFVRLGLEREFYPPAATGDRRDDSAARAAGGEHG